MKRIFNIFFYKFTLFFGFALLFNNSALAQVCDTKYSNCIENMPFDLTIFQTQKCKDKSISAGKPCLLAYDLWFEEELSKNDLTAFQKWSEAKKNQDSGDSQACIRYQNGVLKRPREAFLNRTAQLQNFIKKTALYYGVPAEAIVCAIGGDATTTSGSYPNQGSYNNPMIQKQPIDEATRDLSKMGLSFNNPPMPTDVSAALDEIQSIRNTALILRHDSETYKAAGFTNSDLPVEVLASIYHMGAYRGNERYNAAAKTARDGRKPGMSFIGLFCDRFKSTFRLKLGI